MRLIRSNSAPSTCGHRSLIAAGIAICAALIGSALAQSGDVLSTTEGILRYVEDHHDATMEDVISKLSEEFRSNFHLVYDSKSPVGASLETPRVILRSHQSQEIVAFAGHSSMRNGLQMELARFNPVTQKPDLSVITFHPQQKVVIERQPPQCGGCHGLKVGSTEFRHIWKPYPDWLGVYGSSHNGMIHYRGNGTSLLSDTEYETKAFERFVSHSADGERYRHLVGLREKRFGQLAEMHAQFTDELGLLNIRRFVHRFIHAPKAPANAADLEQLEASVASQPSVSHVEKGISEYYNRERALLLSQVEKYGYKRDKARFSKAGVKIVKDLDMVALRKQKSGLMAFDLDEMHVNKVSKVVSALDQVGAISTDVGMTKELGTYVSSTAHGDSDLGSYFFSIVKDTLAKRAHGADPCVLEHMKSLLVP